MLLQVPNDLTGLLGYCWCGHDDGTLVKWVWMRSHFLPSEVWSESKHGTWKVMHVSAGAVNAVRFANTVSVSNCWTRHRCLHTSGTLPNTSTSTYVCTKVALDKTASCFFMHIAAEPVNVGVDVEDYLLTRTSYPGFLCSKDVWVILILSVSILVPLWE